MASTDGNQTRASNIPAIERATRRRWDEWLTHFESHGAAQLTHADIAKLALSAMPEGIENPEWWAQGVAIAFEQHAGLRVPGQSAAGGFRVSASRTLTMDRDAALAAWTAQHGDDTSHLGFAVSNVRESQTEKRSFVRFSLEGAGKVEVAAELKGTADSPKTSISINHTGLESGERIEEWRGYWKTLLGEL